MLRNAWMCGGGFRKEMLSFSSIYHSFTNLFLCEKCHKSGHILGYHNRELTQCQRCASAGSGARDRPRGQKPVAPGWRAGLARASLSTPEVLPARLEQC